MGDSSNAAPGISGGSSWNAGKSLFFNDGDAMCVVVQSLHHPFLQLQFIQRLTPLSDGPGGSGGGGAQQRGVYWKRNDSMRLVHLLIDPELKPAFISMESQSNPHRSSMESNVLSYKQ